MSNDDGKGNRTGSHKHSYVPTLQSGNPQKVPKRDWWNEVCKTHGEKNHFPMKGTYRGDSPMDD